MTTLQEVIDLARIDLNDPAKIRWPDAALLKFANDALQLARTFRADLFVGSLSSAQNDLTVGGTFPLPLAYRRPVADYIIGRAALKDDENAQMDRAPGYLQMFKLALGV